MKRNFFTVFVLILSLILVTGCMNEITVPENDSGSVITDVNSTNQGSPSGSTAKGNLKLYLTDSSEGYKDPPDFAGGPPEGNGPPNFNEQYLEVNILISRIEGHIAEDEEDGEDGYWEILHEWDPGYAINLMDIQNVSVLLASLDLEPNKYTQLRIFLAEDAELVLMRDEAEVTEPLKIPSSAQTGIKLNHPFEIVSGSITKLTINFTAEKSVVKLGNGEYLMKPVIGLSSETYSTSEDDLTGLTGSVSGNVSYYDSTVLALTGIDGAEVELTGGSYLFENTTSTSIDGSFSLTNVPADMYTIQVHAEGYGDYSENIEVVAGSETVVEVVFLTEEPGKISGTVIVIDEDTNSPIQGAIVTATLSGGSSYNLVSSTETDSSGGYLLEQLPVGTYDLSATAEGYLPSDTQTVVVESGTITSPVDISLSEETTS